MRPYSLAVVAVVLSLSTLPALGGDGPRATRTWLDRPWHIRYVLFVDEGWSMQLKHEAAPRLNAQKKSTGNNNIYLDVAELLDTWTILTVSGDVSIAVAILKFDRVGRMLDQPGILGKMVAKRNKLDDIVLVNDNAPSAVPYYLANWSQGILGNVTFSPAVCSSRDWRRYTNDWSVYNAEGNFGCREWTAQLYDRNRAYIDVTSYSPLGTYINELVGWSRFEDPPKPVIGRNGETWLCLHECPAGEKPGVIPDIKKWTAKHGYPMPQRPRKQPLYPDADYMEDLNE
jgi:hypothetical protein